MSKFVALGLLALAACVTYAQLNSSETEAGLNELMSHYKCYQARHAKRTPRFQPETVFLTDQFRDNVETSVLKLNSFCSRATQNPIGTGTAAGYANDLTCYSIRDKPRQDRFTPRNVQVSDKLAGEQVLTVSKTQSLCVPALKQPIDISLLDRDGFLCYQAKTAKGEPRFQQRSISLDDQFDDKDVRVIRPVAFCTQTEKKVEAPNDDIGESTHVPELPLVVGDHVDHTSTVHATSANDDPIITCKTDYTNSVWYHWYAGTNRSIVLRTTGTTYDTVVAVFTGSRGNLQEVGCNDDVDTCNTLLAGQFAGNCLCADGSAAGVDCCQGVSGEGGLAGHPCEFPTTSLLQFNARANTDYYILVGSSDGHGGKLKFNVSFKSDAPDACSTSASPIGALTFVGQSFLGSHGSTMNAGPNAAGTPTCPADPPTVCNETPEHTVWSNYTVPSSQTQEVTFDASTSSYDTLVAVFDAFGTLVACHNDSVTASPLLPGQTYRIMVGDVDPDQEGGKLKLWLTLKGIIDAGEIGGVQPAAVPFDSLTCYQVRQARHRTETERALDQFSARQLPFTKDPGFWTLTVGGVDSACVPSSKVPCHAGLEAVQPAAPVAQGC